MTLSLQVEVVRWLGRSLRRGPRYTFVHVVAEFAMLCEMRTTPAPRTVGLVALLLLLIIGFPACLYAYRSQSPAVQTVPLTQAMAEIQGGHVDEILLENDRATLTLTDAAASR